MKLISYSLFSSKQDGDRPYDQFDHQDNRYWLNIPFLTIINNLFYPDFKMRIYTDPLLKDHVLYPILDKLHTENIIEVVQCNLPYQGTKATLWRMMPVWENHNVTMCRDLDSVPNSQEAKATLAFLNSEYVIQSMRTHREHNVMEGRFLAGLCAFKSEVSQYLEGSFEDYYAKSGDNWGCDQSILIDYFITRLTEKLGPDFIKNNMLDTVINNPHWEMMENMPEHDAGKLSQETYDNTDISHIDKDILEILDFMTSWPGQPVNANETKREYLKITLSKNYNICKQVEQCVKSNDIVRKFYNV